MAMESIEFINDIVRNSRFSLPFIHDLQEEGRFLLERERAEKKNTADLQLIREECETKKIIAALEKEKKEDFVKRKRHEQLMETEHSLRELGHYVNTAKSAKDLVTQLKLEDERIEQRFEEAKKEALRIRAEYRAMEERQKQLEEKKRLEGYLHREDVKVQIEQHALERIRQQEKKVKEGIEMRHKMEKVLEQERLEYEAGLIAKQKWRQEVLDNLRKKKEFLLQEKRDDTKAMLAYFELERQRAEWERQKKEEKRKELERRQAISAKVGQRNWEIENSKKQQLEDLFDYFVMEKQHKEELAEKKRIEKEQRLRHMYQNEFLMHLERKQLKKDRQEQINKELALERKPIPPDEQDNPPYKPRTELERLQLARLLLEKAAIEREHFERASHAKRVEHEFYAKQKEAQENEIESVRREFFNQQPIPLLRYFPSSVVRGDFIPQPLCQKVRQAVKDDPIPLLTKKRHQLRVRGYDVEELKQVKCYKTCLGRNKISNIF